MNAKIFMCTHKEVDLIPPLCVPVLGGSALREPISGIMSDDGENGSISEKNPSYCELTVQYYAYKNEDCDYYGFCHYRRFFGTHGATCLPYLAVKKPKISLLASKEEITALLDSYDIIAPRTEDVGLTVYEKYASSKHHFINDLDAFLEIINKKAPFLAPYAKEYMESRKQYFCNMFIMPKEIFFEYSKLLFSLLEDFDKIKTPHGSFQADRTNGYLGERFLGIYLTYLGAQGKKIYHLPRIDAYTTLKKRLAFRLFPPESKRRLKLKRGVK